MTTTRKKLQMEKARALAKDKHAEVANICAELAEIYKRGGEHRNALLEYQDMELMLTKSSASWEGMASVKRAIGEAHLALDETEEAIAQHTEMLALAEATNDTVEVQRAFATIATTYFVVATLNDNDEKMLRKAGESKRLHLLHGGRGGSADIEEEGIIRRNFHHEHGCVNNGRSQFLK